MKKTKGIYLHKNCIIFYNITKSLGHIWQQEKPLERESSLRIWTAKESRFFFAHQTIEKSTGDTFPSFKGFSCLRGRVGTHIFIHRRKSKFSSLPSGLRRNPVLFPHSRFYPLLFIKMGHLPICKIFPLEQCFLLCFKSRLQYWGEEKNRVDSSR